MHVEPLDFHHRDLLQDRFQNLQLDISEYSFANLFLFRHTHQYEMMTLDEKLFIKGTSYDKKTYAMPTYDISTENEEFLRSLLQHVDMLYPIPEVWAKPLIHKGFQIHSLDDDNDYIFCVDTLKQYSGRHLASRRNLVAQFKSQYQATISPISPSTIDQALQVVSSWSKQHKGQQVDDSSACREAIKNCERLHLTGMLFSVEEIPVGFIIGEPLMREMFVLHFAKADIQYKGIYQFMYQEFAKAASNYRFLNWEQDLGEPGLRQAKKSYAPQHLVKKMRAM